MKLGHYLLLCVSALFAVLLAGTAFLYLSGTRDYLQDQLEAHAQETATSLALAIGSARNPADAALLGTIVNPVFDRGYFASIRVVAVSGETIARKDLPVDKGEVPAWFVQLFPLRAPSSESIVSAGWKELGRVSVVSHPHFAYLQLWHTGAQTVSWLIAAFILAMLGSGNPVRYLDGIVARQPGIMIFLATWLLLLVQITMVQKSPFTPIIDTFLMPMVLCAKSLY